MNRTCALALAFLLTATGCGRDADDVLDSAPTDAAPPAADDAATPDAGPEAGETEEAPDAAAFEAPDAETPDAETPDAETPEESPEPPASGGFETLFAEVFQPAGCAGAYCHHAGEGGAPAFWRWLTTERAALSPCADDAQPLVVPGDPEASLLYRKVAPGLAVCGNKMPAARAEAGLPAADAARVRAWIRDGARY